VTSAPARVIVTRPEPDAGAFADLCAANGFNPVRAPLMTLDVFRRAPDLDGAGALAFTSANGARAFAANSNIRTLIVFAVGGATAEAARAAGFGDIRAAGGDVDDLARVIAGARGELEGAVVHVAGSDRAGDLVAALGAAGVAARREVLYAARAVDALPPAARDALRTAGSVLWAALFSPRTARLFVRLAREAGLAARLAGTRAACLSDAVADAAREQGARWGSLEVAADRTMESMIDLMRS